jgi:hypothetical protein
MEKALPFQKWIAGEVLPSIRKTGGYAVAKTPAEMLLDSVQMLVEQERRQRAVEAEQRAQGARLTAIEQRAEAGERALRALPAPAVEAPGRTQRMEINQLVRNFCYQTGADHRAAWGRLYREVRDRCHVDLKRRADNAEMSVLDLAEHLDAGEMPGLLRQIYAVAHDLFVTGPARIVREGQDVEA